MSSQAVSFTDIIINGVARGALSRSEDATISTLPSPYFYVDADDPTYDANSHIGHDIIDSKSWYHNDRSSTLSIAQNVWNGAPVFNAVGTAHYLSLRRVPNLSSFTFLTSLSISASDLTALTGGTLGVRSIIEARDDVSGNLLAGMRMFTSGNAKGFSMNPAYAVAGNGFNALINNFRSITPVADVPFVVGWSFNLPTKTSKFYFNGNLITSHPNHVTGDAGGGNGRYWLLGFNNLCFAGHAGKMFMHDDTTTPMTANQVYSTSRDWLTRYGH